MVIIVTEYMLGVFSPLSLYSMLIQQNIGVNMKVIHDASDSTSACTSLPGCFFSPNQTISPHGSWFLWFCSKQQTTPTVGWSPCGFSAEHELYQDKCKGLLMFAESSDIKSHSVWSRITWKVRVKGDSPTMLLLLSVIISSASGISDFLHPCFSDFEKCSCWGWFGLL